MKRLRHIALDLLARREHSQHELRQKLKVKGFVGDEVDQLLADLQQSDLQSDDRFAEAYIRNRCSAGYGPRRIAAELKQRGITTLPDIVLNENDTYWQQQLDRVWRKKFALKPQDAKAYAKQVRFLLYRGFESAQVGSFLRSL